MNYDYWETWTQRGHWAFRQAIHGDAPSKDDDQPDNEVVGQEEQVTRGSPRSAVYVLMWNLKEVKYGEL